MHVGEQCGRCEKFAKKKTQTDWCENCTEWMKQVIWDWNMEHKPIDAKVYTLQEFVARHPAIKADAPVPKRNYGSNEEDETKGGSYG